MFILKHLKTLQHVSIVIQIILKHLKTLQHVSSIIQIIFRELVCSLLKSLILKFVKHVKSQCGDATA